MKIDPKLNIAVGIDIGHSRVKYGFSYADDPKIRHNGSFPTVVIDYFKHSSEDTRLRIEKENLVELNGAKYFFGDTAMNQGNSNTYTGQERDWINTKEHDVLILGAWHKIHQKLKELKNVLPKGYVITFGLPTKFYASQKEVLLERINNLLKDKLLEGQQIKVIIKAQSEAPLSCLAFDETGNVSKDHKMSEENWGVVEGGHFSTDYTLFYKGEVINKFSDSSSGAYMVYEELDKLLSAKYPTNINGVLSEIIENKQFYYNNTTHDLTDEVEKASLKYRKSMSEKMKVVFGEHKGLLHGIIIAGGATPLVFDSIKEEYPNAIRIPNVNPREIVLESFIRLGLFAINVKKIFDKVENKEIIQKEDKK